MSRKSRSREIHLPEVRQPTWMRGEAVGAITSGSTGSFKPYRPGTTTLANVAAITVTNEGGDLADEDVCYAVPHADGTVYVLKAC